MNHSLDRSTRKIHRWGAILTLLPCSALLAQMPEATQHRCAPGGALVEAHYETDEMVVRQGDSRTGVSIILAGKAVILSESGDGEPQVVGELGPGDCFGVIEFLDKSLAKNSIQCTETLDIVTYNKQELEPLLLLPEIRRSFENLRLEQKE